MDNFPDKDIDFQEGSKQHDFPFKEGAWDKMDVLLDKEVQKRRKKRWLILAFFSFALIGISIVVFKYNQTLNPTPNTPSNKIEPTPSHIEMADLNNSTIDDKITITDNNNATPPTRNTDDLKTTTATDEIAPTNSKSLNLNKQIGTEQMAFSGASKQTNKHRALTENTIEQAPNGKATANTTPNTLSIQKTLSNIILETDDKQRSIIQTTSISSGQIQPLIEKSGQELPLVEIDVKKPRQHQIKLGIVAGQEWSSVGMLTESKKGYKLGLELAYQFKNKFQLSTGFIVSKKKYETQATNYQAREARWVDDSAPQTVQGSCDIVEIPLDIAYYFKGYNQSSFFLNGGFNSYLMRKEWYDYEYEAGTDMQGLPTFWTGSMKNNHIFSVTNFSIGYQQVLNDKTTLQFAPYVQVPLTGIGDGQVKLFTTGLHMKLFFGK